MTSAGIALSSLFWIFFYETADKIYKESKLCVFMGDFNINLLNSDSQALTGEFINPLCSYSFQPHILQPARITGNSATLIDNIFLNSLEHASPGGNMTCFNRLSP